MTFPQDKKRMELRELSYTPLLDGQGKEERRGIWCQTGIKHIKEKLRKSMIIEAS